MSSDGGQQVTCDGISEMVRSQEGVFLTEIDDDIEVLDPRKTGLVQDADFPASVSGPQCTPTLPLAGQSSPLSCEPTDRARIQLEMCPA